jgi:hypothetical protein
MRLCCLCRVPEVLFFYTEVDSVKTKPFLSSLPFRFQPINKGRNFPLLVFQVPDSTSDDDEESD